MIAMARFFSWRIIHLLPRSYCEGGCTLQEVCLCGNNDLWEAQQALAQAVSSYTTRLREETHADIAILGQVERNERRFDKQAEIMKIVSGGSGALGKCA